MRTKLILASLAVALVCAGAAMAGNGRGGNQGHFLYAYVGQLTTTPSNGGVSINVTGGNHAALRSMLGQPVTQTFTYDSTTEFLRWSAGKPTVVQPSDLAAGDYVRVNVRSYRGADLETIEHKPAGIVGDHGTQLFKPNMPLYLFRGTLTSVGTSSVTVHVTGGDRRALRLLLGNANDQSFAFGDNTIFLLWQGKVPTVIDSTHLVVGDKIVVRVRAKAGSSLATVESTPANHIGDREPANAK